MYNSHRNDKKGGYSGGKKFDRPQQPWKRDFDSRGFEKPQMHPAVCAECGEACQVPFKPNGREPIYCSNCFKKDGGAGGFEPRQESRSFGSGDKPLFRATCDSCQSACEVPFRPTGERPVYCRDCFGKAGMGRGERTERPRQPETRSIDYSVEEFKKLNAKLDSILAALSQAGAPKAPREEAADAAPKAAPKKKPASKKKK